MHQFPSILFAFLLFTPFANGQEPEAKVDSTGEKEILLANGGLEDHPRVGRVHGRPPRGWYDCGPPQESTVDLHSSSNTANPFFSVTHEAFQGKTYMGMIARDNDTWESISQKLRNGKEPLLAGTTYKLTVALSRSEDYISPSRYNPQEVINHNQPILFRLWGGNSYCQKAEQLARTDLVEHTDWRVYSLVFRPTENLSFLTIEAFYKVPSLMPYNGNLLVDDMHLYELTEEAAATAQNSVASSYELASTGSDFTVKDDENWELTDLESFLKAEGVLQQFVRKQELLDYLKTLAEKLEDFPDQRLVIGLTEKEFKRKGFFIRDAFAYYKLPDTYFKLVQIDEAPTEGEWLSVNEDFAWRLAEE
ncbi:MAG: hypothetical protein AAFV95_16800 [Bacteroidota bacterium]